MKSIFAKSDDSNTAMNPPNDDALNQNEAETTCYICWEEATDDRPTHRDCSCKGTMGWAHTDCLIASAKSRTDPLRPWNKCPHCLERYRDPTKKALQQAIWGADQKWKRILSIVRSLVKQLCIYVTLYLFQFLGTNVMQHSLESALVKMNMTWDQVVVDYQDGNYWSASLLQLVVPGVAVVALVARYWDNVKPFLVEWLFYTVVSTAAIFTALFAAEATGLNVMVTYAAGAIVWLSCLAYHHRAELRQQGYWAALASGVVMVVGIVIALHLEERIIELWRWWWSEPSKDEWDELEQAFLEMLEKLRAKGRFNRHLQAIREEYWWWCS